MAVNYAQKKSKLQLLNEQLSPDTNPDAPPSPDLNVGPAPKPTITMGTPSPSNPLGKGATPPSLGATGSTAAQKATGSAPLTLEQQQALGSAPLSPTAAGAVGANTVNPNTVKPGGIAGVTTAQPSGVVAAGTPSPADLLKQALTGSGGPPPGFTGTFGGKQYVGGREVGAGTTIPTTQPGSTSIPGAAGPQPPSTATLPGGSATNVMPGSQYHALANVSEEGRYTPPVTPTENLAQTTTQAGDGGAPTAEPSPTENLSSQSGGDLGNISQSILNQLNDLQNSINQAGQPADVMVLFDQQLKSLLAGIDAEEKRIRDDAAKAGTSVDPATEFTLGKLREELDRQLKGSAMALNSRGLFDSGILAQTENDLRKGSMSDQAMVLSTRLSKIQDDLIKSLQGLSSRRLDVAQDISTRGIGAQLEENRSAQNRKDSLSNQLLNAKMNYRGQLSDEANQSANRAQSRSENQLDREFKAKQAELERQYGDKQFAAKSAAEFAQNARDYEQKKQLLQQEYDLRLRNDNATAKAGGGGGTTNITRPAGTTTLGQQALASLQNSFGDPDAPRDQSAVDRFNEIQDQLIRDGLSAEDMRRLQQAAIAIDNARVKAANAQHTSEAGKYAGLTLK